LTTTTTTTGAPTPGDLTLLRAALERQLHHADRIIDPWHEGVHESSEQLALTSLAATTRAYLTGRGTEAAEAPLGRALDLAESETDTTSPFTRLMLLDGVVRRYLASIGEPVRRQED
jgi:hypothetical protein